MEDVGVSITVFIKRSLIYLCKYKLSVEKKNYDRKITINQSPTYIVKIINTVYLEIQSWSNLDLKKLGLKAEIQSEI